MIITSKSSFEQIYDAYALIFMKTLKRAKDSGMIDGTGVSVTEEGLRIAAIQEEFILEVPKWFFYYMVVDPKKFHEGPQFKGDPEKKFKLVELLWGVYKGHAITME